MVQERLKAIKKQYGSKELGKVTVDMTIGGMRGITVRGTVLHGNFAMLARVQPQCAPWP